jgi:hypothetical protein
MGAGALAGWYVIWRKTLPDHRRAVTELLSATGSGRTAGDAVKRLNIERWAICGLSAVVGMVGGAGAWGVVAGILWLLDAVGSGI